MAQFPLERLIMAIPVHQNQNPKRQSPAQHRQRHRHRHRHLKHLRSLRRLQHDNEILVFCSRKLAIYVLSRAPNYFHADCSFYYFTFSSLYVVVELQMLALQTKSTFYYAKKYIFSIEITPGSSRNDHVLAPDNDDLLGIDSRQ